MKREIKFRAQELGSGEWVYGDLIHKRTAPGEMMIRQRSGVESDVDVETVGQYTGVKDKAGNEMVWQAGKKYTYVIKIKPEAFDITVRTTQWDEVNVSAGDIEF